MVPSTSRLDSASTVPQDNFADIYSTADLGLCSGKTVFIIGAAAGIGQASAVFFCRCWSRLNCYCRSYRGYYHAHSRFKGRYWCRKASSRYHRSEHWRSRCSEYRGWAQGGERLLGTCWYSHQQSRQSTGAWGPVPISRCQRHRKLEAYWGVLDQRHLLGRSSAVPFTPSRDRQARGQCDFHWSTRGNARSS